MTTLTFGPCEPCGPWSSTTVLKLATEDHIHKLYLVQFEAVQTFHFHATKRNLQNLKCGFFISIIHMLNVNLSP